MGFLESADDILRRVVLGIRLDCSLTLGVRVDIERNVLVKVMDMKGAVRKGGSF